MKKRILTIDGGGIKGVFAASFLAELEDKCRCRICDCFDMIAGTSTGGIIAAALSLGLSADKIRELYLKKGKDIFPENKKNVPFFKGKYETEPLKNALSEVFGTKKIRDCKTRLLIPAFNLESRTIRVFKTPHSEDLYFDKDLLLVDCILATTAAPLYFKPYKAASGVFVDGGIGANNPALIAVVEGITRCGWDKSDISLLSVGCVDEPGITTGCEQMGLADAIKIYKCFMMAESQYSENICGLLLPKDQYFRINQMALPNQVGLDQADEQTIEVLRHWGTCQAQKHIQSVKTAFLTAQKEDVHFYNLEDN